LIGLIENIDDAGMHNAAMHLDWSFIARLSFEMARRLKQRRMITILMGKGEKRCQEIFLHSDISKYTWQAIIIIPHLDWTKRASCKLKARKNYV